MHGQIVYMRIGMLQNRSFPGSEGRHIQIGASAGDQLNGRIHPFHDLGGFDSQTAVFFRCLMPDLPGTVHLISEAPELDVVRIGCAISDTHITVIGSARMIAVFHQGTGRVGTAGS